MSKITSLHIFEISCRKEWGMKLGFLPADKHKGFLPVDSITLCVHVCLCVLCVYVCVYVHPP